MKTERTVKVSLALGGERIIQVRYLALRVGQNWVVQAHPLNFLNILAPSFVEFGIVNAQSNYLDITLLKLRLKTSNFS